MPDTHSPGPPGPRLDVRWAARTVEPIPEDRPIRDESADPLRFAGLRVAALRARMAGPMADLIARHGGVPVEAPAFREVPLGENPEAIDFADRLLAGEFDVVDPPDRRRQPLPARGRSRPEIPREAFLAALGRIKVVVRGPKPLAVMREWKVRVDVQVPEPNTWREILADARRPQLPVAGLRVAVQEYGKPNPD